MEETQCRVCGQSGIHACRASLSTEESIGVANALIAFARESRQQPFDAVFADVRGVALRESYRLLMELANPLLYREELEYVTRSEEFAGNALAHLHEKWASRNPEMVTR